MDEQRREEIQRRIEATGRKLGRSIAQGSHKCEEFATAFACTRPLPKVPAAFLASARRVILPSAEIFLRASKGSWAAQQTIYDARGVRPFARN